MITNPGDKAVSQRQTIEAFSIIVSDADGDEVTVGVSGLPAGLSWSSGQVSGTVAAAAAARAHTVTVTANDGVNDAVTATFTITVAANGAPVITSPGTRTNDRGAAITAFGITVSDPDDDTLTVGVSGLPSGLSWSSSSGQVSGTVDAGATVQLYTVTVTASDGLGEAVTLDFGFRVRHRIPLSAGNTIQSPLGPAGSSLLTMGPAQTSARQAFNANPPSGWTSAGSANTSTALATAAATSACTGLGFSLVSGSVFVNTFTWAYGANQVTPPAHQYRARRVHGWAARCE